MVVGEVIEHMKPARESSEEDIVVGVKFVEHGLNRAADEGELRKCSAGERFELHPLRDIDQNPEGGTGCAIGPEPGDGTFLAIDAKRKIARAEGRDAPSSIIDHRNRNLNESGWRSLWRGRNGPRGRRGESHHLRHLENIGVEVLLREGIVSEDQDEDNGPCYRE